DIIERRQSHGRNRHASISCLNLPKLVGQKGTRVAHQLVTTARACRGHCCERFQSSTSGTDRQSRRVASETSAHRQRASRLLASWVLVRIRTNVPERSVRVVMVRYPSERDSTSS